MEVHHSHHPAHKKKWTEYLLEFFMLFLAVFLGFVAENIRENIVERKRERHYVESLLSDLKADTAITRNISSTHIKFLAGQDSLADALINFRDTGNIAARCYSYFRNYTLNTSKAQFNERTISQLLNAGNMRLIEKPGVSDSIMAYNSYLKEVHNQENTYNEYFEKTLDLSNAIFDLTYFRSSFRPSTTRAASDSIAQKKLLTTDPAVLKRYVIELTVLQGISQTYVVLLDKAKARATRLIHLLQKKYDLNE